MIQSKDLENLIFKGFSNIRWDYVLSRIIIESRFNPIGKVYWYKVLMRCFVSKGKIFEFQEQQNAKIFCFTDNDRKSGREKIDKLCKLFPTDYMKVYSSGKLSFHFLIGIRIFILYLFSWIKELYKSGMSFNEKLYVLIFVIDFFIFSKTNKIKYNKYKLIIVYHDAIPPDSFVVEMGKKLHIPTATLQHGQFTAYRENKLENSGIEFKAHHSDYMLCWNKFTIAEAAKDGINVDNFICAGILDYIGCNIVPNSQSSHDNFGVVINHPFWEDGNIKMIKAANLLATATGLKYYLKLHPNYKDDYFNNYVDSHYFLGIIDRDITVPQYASMVDFSIVGSSSVFVELVYIKHKTIRYSDKSITDKFRDITTDIFFEDPQSVIKAYSKLSNEKFSVDTFDLLCTIEDVTGEYKKFIEGFVDVKG